MIHCYFILVKTIPIETIKRIHGIEALAVSYRVSLNKVIVTEVTGGAADRPLASLAFHYWFPTGRHV
jgi:hypothetical protein